MNEPVSLNAVRSTACKVRTPEETETHPIVLVGNTCGIIPKSLLLLVEKEAASRQRWKKIQQQM